MQFDVIIGNPPYQLDTGGSGRQAKPIYHLFVEQAKKLSPRYLSMVIPARWFAGGMGLRDFRDSMLSDSQMSQLIDFPTASDVFPGVDIAGGVCYFLWAQSHKGTCDVTRVSRDETRSIARALNEFDIFVRDPDGVRVIRKVVASGDFEKGSLRDRVSSIRPFGMPTNYKPKNEGVPCWFIQRIGRAFAAESDVSDPNGFRDKWKLLIPKAPIAGQTDFTKPLRMYHRKNAFVARPGEVCTESWIVAGAFKTRRETEFFQSYLFTKVVRFLILQTVVSQDVNRMNYAFVPDLIEYTGVYADADLCRRWGISDAEWSYIDSRVVETGGINEYGLCASERKV